MIKRRKRRLPEKEISDFLDHVERNGYSDVIWDYVLQDLQDNEAVPESALVNDFFYLCHAKLKPQRDKK